MEEYEDYKDIIIGELKETNEKLVCMNKQQIEVNMRFADVTEDNNKGYQRTMKLLILCSIAAIVAVSITAMFLIHIADVKFSESTNINTNTNTNKNK